jgi:hypothetical protein
VKKVTNPIHPSVFYSTFGEPVDGVVDAEREDVVVPLESFTWSGPLGPDRFTRGVPRPWGDPHEREKMRKIGLIK